MPAAIPVTDLSPAEEATMVRVPDAAAQVRRAPVKTLRDFLAAIGQLLGGTDHEHRKRPVLPDNLIAKLPAAASQRGQDARPGRHRATGRPGPAASGQTPSSRFRSLDSTGNVRLLPPDEAVQDPPNGVPPAAELASPADLPVPGFDKVSLPSLRSRLRNLDAAQLRALADYERATANRADVLGMLERRIAKLQAADTHAS
jgi:hypothetical protein